MYALAPGSRRATTALAIVAAATFAVAPPSALAEDVGATDAANLTTPSLRRGLQRTDLPSLPSLGKLPVTTQPPPSVPNSIGTDGLWIFTRCKEDIEKEWANLPYPIIPAVCSLVFGLVAVIHGEHAFRVLSMIFIGLVVGILAREYTKFSFEKPSPSIWQIRAVGAEMGVFAAFLVWKSYEGLKIGVGTLFGILMASKAESLLCNWAGLGAWSLWTSIAVYSVFAIGGILSFSTGGHKRPLAMLMPVLGGTFVVSALYYMITDLVDHLKKGEESVKMGTWLDFFGLLWGPLLPHGNESKDVGVFSGEPFVFGHFGPWKRNVLVSYALWLIVALLGIAFQLKQLKKEKKKAAQVKAAQPNNSTSTASRLRGLRAAPAAAKAPPPTNEPSAPPPASTPRPEGTDDKTTPLLDKGESATS